MDIRLLQEKERVAAFHINDGAATHLRVCSAEGCGMDLGSEAKKRCGACRCTAYCSKECQVGRT